MAKSDPLTKYRSMRDFSRTSEPRGRKGKTSRRSIFVVQKHAATRLHYDFRLEVGGVLKSWAIPKGPSYDTRQKRLAAQTEDHPLDYATFEGTIPRGAYGGGTVMVWDLGYYRNLKEDAGQSMEECLERGLVEIWLEGRKLQGGWNLVRTGATANWLLIKRRDEEADPERNPVEQEMLSVLSDRSLEEIAQGVEKKGMVGHARATWSSNRETTKARRKTRATRMG